MIRTLLLTFIPLFVAVDVVAVVLMYLGIGMVLGEAARRRLVLEAMMAGVGPSRRCSASSSRPSPSPSSAAA